jgi:xylan 1,4-beta-xylosidase
LVARRVQAFNITAETKVDFQPETFQQMAGLIAYYDTENHYYLRLSHNDELGRVLNIITTDAGHSEEILENDIAVPTTGLVRMRLSFQKAALRFQFGSEGNEWQEIGPVLNGAILSDDYNHLGFTGAFVGICCQDISGRFKPADFSCFHYRENA